MDIMELGAIGELVGGVAVIASLLFVGVQIRKQTREQLLAAGRELSVHFNQTIAPLIEDPALLALWRQAVRDYDSLSADDRIRIGLFLDRHTRAYEQHYLHASHSRLDPEYLESVRASYSEGFAFPGVRRWWELNQDRFSTSFRRHVDKIVNLRPIDED
jgi:hypothetical protein